jgi:hypothetical protein
MSNEASSTTNEGDLAPTSSREFTKMELELHSFFNETTHPSSDTMKVTIDREWDLLGNLGNFPKNVERIVWAWRENDHQFIGVGLTNGSFVYIHVIEKEEDYLVIPVSDEDGLDFFKPIQLRHKERKTSGEGAEFTLEDGMFDLADEV